MWAPNPSTALAQREKGSIVPQLTEGPGSHPRTSMGVPEPTLPHNSLAQNPGSSSAQTPLRAQACRRSPVVMSHGCQDLLLIGASKSSRPNCGQLRATLEAPTRCTLGAVLQRRRPNRHRPPGKRPHLCGVADARASLRCAMRAGAGSARRPSSARGASRRRRRTPQTGSATQPVPPPPGAPCVPSSLKEEGLLTRIRN